LILIVLAALARWALNRRSAQTPKATAPTAAQLASDQLEVSPQDVLTVQSQTLTLQVPVSGAVQAVRSAWVKARVAGDLKQVRVQEGETVQQGQVVALTDDTDAKERLRQASRQVEMARAQLQTAQLGYDNNQALVNQGFISKTALINSQASLTSAKANLDQALAGERIAEKALADTVLKAPLSGQVASVLMQSGERANPDARILEVVDLSALEVMVSLNPSHAAGLAKGQSARLQVEGQAQPLSAQLLRINPSVDPATRSVRAYLQLPSATGLRQGLFAQGHLQQGQTQGLAVPLSAVRTDRPEPHVLALVDQRVRVLPVQMGARGPLLSQPEGGQWVIITAGLSGGEQVLAASTGALREGLQVRVVTPSKGQ
jgi:RND family efflux transporter MFP subunit